MEPSSAPSSSRVRIELTPKPGFCIKTSTLGGVIQSPAHLSKSAGDPSLKPTAIPEGLKVFVNIAWDPQVPSSPTGSEEAILRALEGEDVEEEDAMGLYIPAIVSNAREDKDKAGNPSLVFDCIYNTSVKARTLNNPDFKTFLIDLSIQRIETQAGIILSRDIRTPNILSKGKLLPRTADIPASLLLETPSASPPSSTSKSNLPTSVIKAESLLLDWSWTKDDLGKIRIEVKIPGLVSLTSSLIDAATLDIEPRKLLLTLPNYRPLEIDLKLSDAEINSRSALLSGSGLDGTPEKLREEKVMRILRLKRERDFNVEAAEAEWKIGSGEVVIYV